MGRNKEGTPIKCQHCGYEWLTKSKMFYVCCPNCMYRVKTQWYYKKFGHKDDNIKKNENNINKWIKL